MEMNDEQKRRRFMNALSNYLPVIGIIDGFKEEWGEELPAGWTNPFQLYGGYLQELKAENCDMDQEKRALLRLLEERSPEWVWEDRRRLVAERMFLLRF